MASNDKTQIAQLGDRIAALEAAIQRIDEKLTPAAPKPPPGPPKWAGSGDPSNVGINYSGPPTGNVTSATGIVGVKPDERGYWRDPSNILRDGEGNIVTPRTTDPRPLGPERTEAHEEAVRFADALFNKEPTR
jgi:hypothetical protein